MLENVCSTLLFCQNHSVTIDDCITNAYKYKSHLKKIINVSFLLKSLSHMFTIPLAAIKSHVSLRSSERLTVEYVRTSVEHPASIVGFDCYSYKEVRLLYVISKSTTVRAWANRTILEMRIMPGTRDMNPDANIFFKIIQYGVFGYN